MLKCLVANCVCLLYESVGGSVLAVSLHLSAGFVILSWLCYIMLMLGISFMNIHPGRAILQRKMRSISFDPGNDFVPNRAPLMLADVFVESKQEP